MQNKADRSQDDLLLDIEEPGAQIKGTQESVKLQYEDFQAYKQVTAILDSITDAILVFDHMWKVICMNQKAEQLLRIDRNDLIDRVYWDVLSDDSKMISYNELHRAMAEQVTVSYERFYLSLNTWFEVLAYPSRDGLFVLLIDVTKHYSTGKSGIEGEEELIAKSTGEGQALIREHQDVLTRPSPSEKKILDLQRYNRGLIEASLNLLLTFDQKGIILDVNEAAVKATGKNREELIGTLFADHFIDTEKAHKRAMAVFEKGEVRDCELVMRSSDGTKAVLSFNASVFRDQSGKVVGAFAAASDITNSRRIEQAFHSQIELEKLIAAISTDFIVSVSTSDIDKKIDNALRSIGDFSGVDRSYIFEFYDNGKKMNNTHEWCKADIEPQIDILQGISIEEDYPDFTERIRRLEVIHVPDVAALPPEASYEKENFIMLEIKSLILVPIVYGRRLIGFLGFDSVRAKKTWKEDDIRLLKMVGEIFANALERKKAQQELEETIKRLDVYTTLVNSLTVTMLEQATNKKRTL